MVFRTARKLFFATLLFTSTAQAQPFTLLILEPKGAAESRQNPKTMSSYWREFNALAAALQKAGYLRGGTALNLGSGQGSQKAMLFPDLGGYFIVEAPSEKNLLDVLATVRFSQPVRIEVRAHEKNPAMPL